MSLLGVAVCAALFAAATRDERVEAPRRRSSRPRAAALLRVGRGASSPSDRPRPAAPQTASDRGAAAADRAARAARAGGGRVVPAHAHRRSPSTAGPRRRSCTERPPMTSARSRTCSQGSPEEDGRERAGARARALALPAGAVLFHLGDAADSLFLVERGRIALTLPMQVRGQRGGRPDRGAAPGPDLGWSALIPPHRFTLKATAPSTPRCSRSPRTALLEHFARAPGGRLPGDPQRGRGGRPAAAGVPGHVAARDAARGRAQPGLSR